VDSVQQTPAAEGLGKEFHSSRFHGAHRHRNVAVSGYENDRNLDTGLIQLALQIMPSTPACAHRAPGRLARQVGVL